MIPLVALITFNVKKIRVKRLLACAELFPFLEGWIQNLLDWSIVSPSEIGNVINCV